MTTRSRVRIILGSAVAVACAFWSYLIFTGAVLGTLPTTYRLLFGVVTMLYGIYRLVLGFVRRNVPEP